ncbi:MAG: type II secretion system protein [Paucibacter sp.]|nr:type II secretion system protein [Roseateles sp.]
MSLRPSTLHQRGFTLMEMLVVITIAGLVTTVLFQSLSQVYGLQDRLGLQLQHSQGGAMQLDWYRQIVQQLQPDVPDSAGRLRGQSREMSALGLDPLSSQPGQPQLMKLRLDVGRKRVRLLWRAGEGREVPLGEWEGLSDAEFVYLDEQGVRHSRWPEPLDTTLNFAAAGTTRPRVQPALPAVVMLHLRDLAGADEWISAVPRSRFEPSRLKQGVGGVL